MDLKIKLIKWSAGLPVAMLNEKTASELGVHAQERISIRTISKYPKEISLLVGTIGKIVKKDEIAVSSEVKKQLGLRIGQKVDVNFLFPSKSLFFIKKKLDGKRLSQEEVNEIIKEVSDNSLSEPEIALFISAMYKQGMSTKETIFLIKAISNSGNKFKLRNKFVVDKHSIGGVPGNITTPIVVSICTAAGLIMPKSSSRAITSAAGTADVIETLAPVEFSMKDLKKIVLKTKGCMVWGGALGMVPADSKIVNVEKQLKIDPISQLIASIMSKKLATDADYILIDIPYGKNAKVNKQRALNLKRKFEYFGKYFKKTLKVVLTDGNQPIGNGIGPALELIDVLKILDPKQKGPTDLQEKSLFLAGNLLEMTKKAENGKGEEMARGILNSGKALEKFKEIIIAQGGALKEIVPAKFQKDIHAKKSGKISSIHNKKIASLARIAGCPMDKSAGLYLHSHLREKLKKGDKILTIYSESKSRLNEAIRFYEKMKPIKIK